MIVKKVNPEWKPSENPDLKVGETIDMTDPKQLILNGDVVGIEDGVEISAYEKYGVYSPKETQEFEDFIAMKKQESLKKKLEAESEELKKKIAEAKPAQETSTETPAPTEEAKVETTVSENPPKTARQEKEEAAYKAAQEGKK